MDVTKLTLPKIEFDKYISSMELKTGDKNWFEAWNEMEFESKIKDDYILGLMRMAHFAGFGQGAVFAAENFK